MEWIDVCAGIAAKTHADMPCVTASVDAVHFLQPIYVGEAVILKASVNRAWRSSMEIGVRVVAENLNTGERRYCCHAYLTFVAVRDGKPVPVPDLVAETPLEKAWYEAAEIRFDQLIQ
jgi:acyl-CoA hydrolase